MTRPVSRPFDFSTSLRIAAALCLIPAAALLAACGPPSSPPAANATPPPAAAAPTGPVAPRFEVDPFWPKPLPNHWLLGSTIGVAVEPQDNVWIIHRSSATLNNNERG